MDSLTQIALGSAVGVAVMGRRTAVWKAALWGGIAGTLPDLDAFIDHGDPILNMTRHRAESHALFFLTLAAPLLGWIASRLDRRADGFQRRAAPSWNRAPEGLRAAAPSLPAQAWTVRSGVDSGNAAACKASDPRSGGAWGHWTLALWLVLITHPLLDAMTVYGTQLLQPFTDHPYGVGSIFIIDPAYTVPLIVGVVAALRLKNRRGQRWNAAGLALSTLYLAWSFGAQQHVDRIARASLQQAGIKAQGLLVTPAPFNTVLWRLVATTPTQYHEGYYSLLDDEAAVRWTAYPRGGDLIERHGHTEPVARIAAFSHGFFSLHNGGDRLLLTDLRMGLEPSYTFRFDLGSPAAVGHVPVTQLGMRPDLGRALPWLWQRLQGNTLATLGAATP
jgi:inner membrane protein